VRFPSDHPCLPLRGRSRLNRRSVLRRLASRIAWLESVIAERTASGLDTRMNLDELRAIVQAMEAYATDASTARRDGFPLELANGQFGIWEDPATPGRGAFGEPVMCTVKPTPPRSEP
jgi:hypothetical protein